MKKLALLTALTSVAMTSLAAAQDGPRLWTDLAETRSLDLSQQGPEGRGRGGQVVEEWYTPTLHASVAIYGRVSWPSNTNVTVDGLWWSDFFNPGWGVSVEGDLGFGFRIMAPPNRGRDVTTAIDPDVLTTFMIELGLTVRF